MPGRPLVLGPAHPKVVDRVLDDAQRVAELVRHAAGELTQRREPLLAHELLARRLQRRRPRPHLILELLGVAVHPLLEPRLRDRDRELRRRLPGDPDLLRREFAGRSAEADRADQLPVGDHGDDHVHADVRGQQRLRIDGRGQ